MGINTDNVKKTVVTNAFWRFGENVSTQLISFVVSVVLARLLMPSEYGLIAMTSIFLAVANVFTISGLGFSLIQRKDATHKDFSTAFYTGLVLSIFVYAIIFAMSGYVAEYLHEPEIKNILRVLGLQLPISAYNSVQSAEISRNMQFKKFFARSLVCAVISGIVGVSMAYAGYGVWALVAQSISGTIANCIFINRVITWRPKLEFSTESFKSMFSFGSKYMGANLIGCFFNEIRGFLIGIKYTPTSLAFYNRGQALPGLINSNVTSTISSVLFPVLAQMQDDYAVVKAAMRRSMKTSSFILAPLVVGLAALSEKIVLIIFTEKWLPCVPFMQVICFQYLFEIIGSTNLQALNAIGKSGLVLKMEFIKKPLYILCILTGMYFSAFGIAVGCLVYSVIGASINAWPNRKFLKYTLIEQFIDVLTPLFISLIMFAVVLLVGLIDVNIYALLTLQILAGAATYILLSMFLQKDRVQYTLSIFKKK